MAVAAQNLCSQWLPPGVTVKRPPAASPRGVGGHMPTIACARQLRQMAGVYRVDRSWDSIPRASTMPHKTHCPRRSWVACVFGGWCESLRNEA